MLSTCVFDAASNTQVDNMRDLLDNAQYAPTVGRFKVYIIDEVHMLSRNAFNAMLKTLEEPPAHVKFILATTDPQKVPVTVLSRCLQFNLRQMSGTSITEHLQSILTQENIPYEPVALQHVARAAAGSMRDALSLLDQAIAYGGNAIKEQEVRAMLGAIDQSYLFELLQSLVNHDGAALMAQAKAMELAQTLERQDNRNLTRQARAMGLTPATTEPLTRSGTIPSVGAVKDLGPRLETIQPGEIAGPVPISGGQIVFQLESREPPDEQALAAQSDSIRQQLLNRKQTVAFALFQDHLKTRMIESGDVRIDAAVLERLNSAALQ